MKSETGTTKNYLSFRVGREWYGIDVGDVIEVLHFMALTDLPGAPPEVLGLMTLRDEVMPVIDLRRRFGLPQADLRVDTPIIAVRAAGEVIGLVVDDADDVEQVHAGQMANGGKVASPYVAGVAHLPNRLLLLLDTDLLKVDGQVRQPVAQP